MATYKGIQGYSVQKLSSDPGTLSEVIGQLWYNSTSGKFKVSVQGAASWSSGGPLNTAREAITQAGTQTAAIAMGGYSSPPVTYYAQTETYNGTTWTETGDLNTARSKATCNVGTQTATLIAAGIAGGSTSALCETFNGTSWTEKADLNVARHSLAGGGTTTAAIAFGGNQAPGPYATALSETWNGSTWTETADLNTGRSNIAGGGLSTAGIGFGGYISGTTYANTETYDGTSWTEVNDLNTASSSGAGAAATNTAALSIGSAPTAPGGANSCESYDGTSWAVTTAFTTARGDIRGTGTSALALIAGGGPAPQTTVEEFDNAPVTAKTVTVS
jgi:hypothetical protein